MGSKAFQSGHYRKLWLVERRELLEHFLRLDAESRRMRFGGEVSDEFISKYAAAALDKNCRIWGFFGPRGNLRGTGELRRFEDQPECAEAAFTVETDYSGKGIGTGLFHHVILSARNLGIRHLYLNCLADNQVMQAIARKFNAELDFDHGEVQGDLIPEGRTPLTRIEEAIEDSSGLVFGMLDIQQRRISLS
jgi:RimJ/RimL family protein N-acetyltransferase